MTKTSFHISDDIWGLRSAALLVVGLSLAAAGLAPWVGLGVTALGATCTCTAFAILVRGIGFDIDVAARRIEVRRLVGSTGFHFDNISYISIRQTYPSSVAFGWNPIGARYEVSLVLRANEEVLVREDLDLETAREIAGTISRLAGSAISDTSASTQPSTKIDPF
jgi:hypothetical protein